MLRVVTFGNFQDGLHDWHNHETACSLPRWWFRNKTISWLFLFINNHLQKSCVYKIIFVWPTVCASFTINGVLSLSFSLCPFLSFFLESTTNCCANNYDHIWTIKLPRPSIINQQLTHPSSYREIKAQVKLVTHHHEVCRRHHAFHHKMYVTCH